MSEHIDDEAHHPQRRPDRSDGSKSSPFPVSSGESSFTGIRSNWAAMAAQMVVDMSQKLQQRVKVADQGVLQSRA